MSDDWERCFEGHHLRPRTAILFLLISAVPIEPDAVVAILTLSLTIQTCRFFLSAFDLPRLTGPAAIS